MLTLLLLLALPALADDAVEVPVEVDSVRDDPRALRLDDLDAQLAWALEHHPDLDAARARQRTASNLVARAGALPRASVGAGVFLQPVETRVGPQQARLSVQQPLPWPGVLTAGREAAREGVRAADLDASAAALDVTASVVDAHWSLWRIRATRDVHRDHLTVLDGLSTTLRARLEVGEATLADLQQVDLTRARLADTIASMDETERAAVARLATAVGHPASAWTPTEAVPTPTSPGAPSLPAWDAFAVVAQAVNHPALSAGEARVDAARSRLRQARAARMPGATVGADWILTGPAVDPAMADSGKDAFLVSARLELPLDARSRGDAVDAARSTVDALDAERRARADRRAAEALSRLSQVRDSARRIHITQGTLLPQAEATYDSLLGSYATGSANVAQVLLAQQALLDLRVALDTARADHARAWAALDATVGTSVPREASP